MKEKINLERPEVGWLSKVKLYDSARPKPVQKTIDYTSLPDSPSASELEKFPEAVESLKRTKNRIM